MQAVIRAVTRLAAIVARWPEYILLEDRACSWDLRYSVWVLLRSQQRRLT
jgi:hypothetical protein